MKISSIVLAIKKKTFIKQTRNKILEYRLKMLKKIVPIGYYLEKKDSSVVKVHKTEGYDFSGIEITGDYVRIAALKMMSEVIKNAGVTGCVAELGVYKGEFAKIINRCFDDRILYLFDTFEGFDKGELENDINKGYSGYHDDFSDTTVDEVMSKMKNPENCRVKKGFFPETTTGLEDEEFCFVSIDADLYDPIYSGLRFFYPRMAQGGVIFVHDYNNLSYSGANKAVSKFCEENDIRIACLPDEYGTAIILA